MAQPDISQEIFQETFQYNFAERLRERLRETGRSYTFCLALKKAKLPTRIKNSVRVLFLCEICCVFFNNK